MALRGFQNFLFIPRRFKTNIPQTIWEKVGRNLHRRQHHPLNIIKCQVENFFKKEYPEANFSVFDNLPPKVSVQQNFDELLIPDEHPSRSWNETYYVDENTVLRCHTSAHQCELIKAGHHNFLATGDVYRRDEIDKTHFPVFHQMEGVRLFDKEQLSKFSTETDKVQFIEEDLKSTLEKLTLTLFGDTEMRWVDAYFPFTDPSFELEIKFRGEWMETLGSGVVQQAILENCGKSDLQGWAFGIGLERLAMSLFQIPDIRLFWTEDDRFHRQFKTSDYSSIIFQPYSKYPPVQRDVSFWIPAEFHENVFHELVRDVAGDLVEESKLVDNFYNPKLEQTSHCYRITYRSMDRSLTNAEVDGVHNKLREKVVSELKASLRWQ